MRLPVHDYHTNSSLHLLCDFGEEGIYQAFFREFTPHIFCTVNLSESDGFQLFFLHETEAAEQKTDCLYCEVNSNGISAVYFFCILAGEGGDLVVVHNYFV